jgi:hypothetical protein
MRDFQRSIRGWFGMINNSTPAENKVKTAVIPPQSTEEKLDSIIEEVETIKEEIKETKNKNKSTDEV